MGIKNLVLFQKFNWVHMTMRIIPLPYEIYWYFKDFYFTLRISGYDLDYQLKIRCDLLFDLRLVFGS